MAGSDQKEPVLHEELQTALEGYRKSRAFNPEEWADAKAKKFNEYMTSNSLTACCVSLSGGVDSALTLALMKHAQSQSSSPIERVVGIAQPIHSSDWALNRATETAEVLGAELIVVDQTELHDQLKGVVDKALGVEGGKYAGGQLRSYQRAPVQYYVAQLITQSGKPCIVMGTGNMDEDGYLAYFCKAGDGVVDVQLIADLHKSEVFRAAKHLKVPDSILNAAPSADLWDGQSDEQELGFTYDFIELYTGLFLKKSEAEQAEFKDSLGEDARKQFDEWELSCVKVHKKNKHKLAGVINL